MFDERIVVWRRKEYVALQPCIRSGCIRNPAHSTAATRARSTQHMRWRLPPSVSPPAARQVYAPRSRIATSLRRMPTRLEHQHVSPHKPPPPHAPESHLPPRKDERLSPGTCSAPVKHQ